MRIKATCSNCKQTILVMIDDGDPDIDAFDTLKVGECFEYKCPKCGEWAAFEVVE